MTSRHVLPQSDRGSVHDSSGSRETVHAMGTSRAQVCAQHGLPVAVVAADDPDVLMREELAAIYTRTVSPQRPPNAATAWERERLRRAARQLVRGPRRDRGIA